VLLEAEGVLGLVHERRVVVRHLAAMCACASKAVGSLLGVALLALGLHGAGQVIKLALQNRRQTSA